MAFTGYAAASRKNWGITTSSGLNGEALLSIEQINAGCLMRIADATEAMAKRHTELMTERDAFEREAKSLRAELERTRRVVAGLRGQITKMSKRDGPAAT